MLVRFDVESREISLILSRPLPHRDVAAKRMEVVVGKGTATEQDLTTGRIIKPLLSDEGRG